MIRSVKLFGNVRVLSDITSFDHPNVTIILYDSLQISVHTEPNVGIYPFDHQVKTYTELQLCLFANCLIENMFYCLCVEQFGFPRMQTAKRSNGTRNPRCAKWNSTNVAVNHHFLLCVIFRPRILGLLSTFRRVADEHDDDV